MYTVLEERRQAEFIKGYMNTHPNCTRKEIIKECVTNFHRLKKLESQGYLNLPPVTPHGMRNR
jgi:hypothetical protein